MRMTAAEWTPWLIASAQAASTAELTKIDPRLK